MRTFTRDEKWHAYQTLPAPVKEYLSSEEHAETFKNLYEKHQLHVDQAGQLGDEVFLMLVGLVSPSEFGERTKETLKLSPEQLQPLVDDVNNLIFKKVRETVIQPQTPAPVQPPVTPEPPQPVVQNPIATIQQKLEAPVVAPRQTQAVPSGIDPYREPTK